MHKLLCILLGALAGSMLVFPGEAFAASLEAFSTVTERVMPSLFPMLTLMLLITSRLPRNAFLCALLSLLTGSPAGARLCAHLPVDIAVKRRLAALTGTMSPMFLLSALPGLIHVPNGLPYLICHLAGSALCALVLCPFGKDERAAAPLSVPQPYSLPQAVTEALKSMGVVLGCVTLANVAVSMLHCALPGIPDTLFALLHALVEVTGGLKALDAVPLPHKGLLAVMFTSFGGLSILMQNAAFWQKGGVGILRLFIYRLVHAIISACLYITLFHST